MNTATGSQEVREWLFTQLTQRGWENWSAIVTAIPSAMRHTADMYFSTPEQVLAAYLHHLASPQHPLWLRTESLSDRIFDAILSFVDVLWDHRTLWRSAWVYGTNDVHRALWATSWTWMMRLWQKKSDTLGLSRWPWQWGAVVSWAILWAVFGHVLSHSYAHALDVVSRWTVIVVDLVEKALLSVSYQEKQPENFRKPHLFNFL